MDEPVMINEPIPAVKAVAAPELPEEQEPGPGRPPVSAEARQAFVECMKMLMDAVIAHYEQPEPEPEPEPEQPVSWLDQIIPLLDRKHNEEGAE